MTRYVEAFSWTESIDAFLRQAVPERPLLNVCSGREPFGDVTMDLYEPATVRGGWTALPFATDSFAAVFADPPWDANYKADSALFVKEALRVALGPYMSAINITPPGRKTEVWEVLDRHDGTLGRIEWYGAWRQYVFAPASAPIFNGGCLTEIVALLASLMAKRRQK